MQTPDDVRRALVEQQKAAEAIESATKAELKQLDDAIKTITGSAAYKSDRNLKTLFRIVNGLRALQTRAVSDSEEMVKAAELAVKKYDQKKEAEASAKNARAAGLISASAIFNKEADKSHLQAEASSRYAGVKGESLGKKQDRVAAKQDALFDFVKANDVIAQMSPHGNVGQEIRQQPTQGAFLKTMFLDRVKKPPIRGVTLDTLNEALEAYIASVARYCKADPVKACEQLGKGEPIAFVGSDNVNHLENLKEAVTKAYTELCQAKKDGKFVFESRTEKFLEELGGKLKITDQLAAIKCNIEQQGNGSDKPKGGGGGQLTVKT